jgi:hypothetical protein
MMRSLWNSLIGIWHRLKSQHAVRLGAYDLDDRLLADIGLWRNDEHLCRRAVEETIETKRQL